MTADMDILSTGSAARGRAIFAPDLDGPGVWCGAPFEATSDGLAPEDGYEDDGWSLVGDELVLCRLGPMVLPESLCGRDGVMEEVEGGMVGGASGAMVG